MGGNKQKLGSMSSLEKSLSANISSPWWHATVCSLPTNFCGTNGLMLKKWYYFQNWSCFVQNSFTNKEMKCDEHEMWIKILMTLFYFSHFDMMIDTNKYFQTTMTTSAPILHLCVLDLGCKSSGNTYKCVPYYQRNPSLVNLVLDRYTNEQTVTHPGLVF